MDIFGSSDIGRIRKINQDRLKFNISGDGTVWMIVCDGMGGPNGGELAAQIAVDAFEYNFNRQYSSTMSSQQLKNLLSVSMNLANIKILKEAAEEIALTGMGTTAVACVVKDNVAHVMHAGDSRLYLIRNGVMEQITKDHSMVQALVDQGDITAEQARNHPEKNLITNALGISEALSCEYAQFDLACGDLLLLCTDGLTNCMDDQEILQTIMAQADIKKLVFELIDSANQNGGKDNITAIVLRI